MICRCVYNAFWDFPHFDPYAQIVPDSLHLADTGLYQSCLMHIFKTIKEDLFQWIPNADKKWEKSMRRLSIRLQACNLMDNSTVKEWVAGIGTVAQKAGAKASRKQKALLKASEFRLLMLVLFSPPPPPPSYDMTYDMTAGTSAGYGQPLRARG